MKKKRRVTDTKWKQGLYNLNNPQKYMGNPSKLIYKSSWEQRVFEFCDNNPNITKWGYELVGIPYMKPRNGKFVPGKYFPDVYIEYFDKDKNFVKEMLEIKPHKQTKSSTSRKPILKMFENSVYMTNLAKWEAARNWCAQRGIKFTIMTENVIFARKKK